MTRIRQLLLFALGVAVLLVGVSLLSSSSNTRDEPGSTANGKSGTLALYTWMTELGFQTSRVEGDFDLHNIDTLFIIEPTQTLSADDRSKIDAFLNSGGDVVVADNTGFITNHLVEKYGIAVGDPVADGNAVPAIPLNSSNSVHSVPVTGASGVSGDRSVPLLSIDGVPVAAGRKVGDGRLFFVTSESPFDNDGLRRGDSAPFVLALVEHARGGRIGFDEFHHGSSGSGQILGLGMDQIFVGPLGLATLIAIILVALYLVLKGRRLGAALPRRDPALVPTASDRLDALSQLVARAGDKGAIARDYVEELKGHVGSITGAPSSDSDAAFIAVLSAGPVAETERLIARGRTLENSKPSERQLVAFAHDVVDLEQRWSNPD